MKYKSRFAICAVIAMLALICGGYFIYQQQTHFNKNVQINGVNVGGLTAKEAEEKLAALKVTKKVYLDNKLIYTSQPADSEFTSKDIAKFEAALKKQATIFPSSKKQSFTITPTTSNGKSTASLATNVKNVLTEANKTRTAAVDAYAILKNGKVSVVSAKKGDQYDVSALLKQLAKQEGQEKIYLKAKYIQPVSADSTEVKTEVTKLKELAKRKLTYTVQTTKYELSASDLVTSARYQNGKYELDTTALKNKIAEINQSQSTLNKSFTFKTTEGNEIQVQGGTYGWAISTTKAEKTLTNALLNNKTSVDAKSDVYGEGYNTGGIGYDVTTNNGIGTTYVEVSIQKQHLWAYKNGQLVASIDVVTGKHSTNNDTPTGVYYIMYLQTNTTLTGSKADGSSYASAVKYWAPFTLDGCGFHDADWRTNWSSTAYLDDGSLGCVNMKPSEAENVYNNLSQNEPVVIY